MLSRWRCGPPFAGVGRSCPGDRGRRSDAGADGDGEGEDDTAIVASEDMHGWTGQGCNATVLYCTAVGRCSICKVLPLTKGSMQPFAGLEIL